MKRARTQSLMCAFTVPTKRCACLVPVLPNDVLRQVIMPLLGAAGDGASFRTLLRLAQTCRWLYDETDWRACVTRLAGPFTTLLKSAQFAPFAPYVEHMVYYLPCHHNCWKQLEDPSWALCTRMHTLALIGNECYSCYDDCKTLPATLEILDLQHLYPRDSVWRSLPRLRKVALSPGRPKPWWSIEELPLLPVIDHAAALYPYHTRVEDCDGEEVPGTGMFD